MYLLRCCCKVQDTLVYNVYTNSSLTHMTCVRLACWLLQRLSNMQFPSSVKRDKQTPVPTALILCHDTGVVFVVLGATKQAKTRITSVLLLVYSCIFEFCPPSGDVWYYMCCWHNNEVRNVCNTAGCVCMQM